MNGSQRRMHKGGYLNEGQHIRKVASYKVSVAGIEEVAMRVLDLFSGVGMMAYGMEKAGHEVVAFCEIEPFPRKVLNKHWPAVPVYEDVRELNRERLEKDGTGSIGIITGGFPCQDISVAGKQSGIDGKRSGLWSECARLTGELRPKYVIWENVGALLSGGDLVDTANGPVYRTWFGRILRDMAEIGYDCEWHCIPAGNPNGLSAGAPHRRERVWIMAYPGHHESQGREESSSDNERRSGESENVADSNVNGRDQGRQGIAEAGSDGIIRDNGGPAQPGMDLLAHGIAAGLARSRWLPEPGIGRVATGVPDRVNKLKALGNGLVWQIPHAIGCAIQEREA
ncbi:DNA cytosine methyltransferase [bacterium]|nr:DNA cytosine methyltransferase [bacterium]